VNDLERMVIWSFNAKNAIYFDNDTKLDNLDKDKMIVLEGIMKMPEMAENIETIQSLRRTELFSMISNTQDEESKKILSFMKDSNNIPLLIELDSSYLVNCTAKRTLINNEEDFLDNLDNSITIIGKIDRVYNSNEKVEVYDLGKEVLKLNRTARRTMKKEDLEKMIITEEGPLIKVIPIIIYK